MGVLTTKFINFKCFKKKEVCKKRKGKKKQLLKNENLELYFKQ